MPHFLSLISTNREYELQIRKNIEETEICLQKFTKIQRYDDICDF